jgi:hypothetical protein
MYRLLAWYNTFSILSIDVAIGAVVGALFFAQCSGISVSFFSLLSLACTVWIIYTADHLLDVVYLNHHASTERHLFHQKHSKRLIQWILIIAGLDCVLLFFLPVDTVLQGLALGCLVALYLVFQSKLKIAKEFSVALLYVAGVVIPVSSITVFSKIDFVVLSAYFFLAFINLVFFSFMEKESDLKDNHASIATILSERLIVRMLMTLLIIAVALCFFLYAGYEKRIQSFVLFAMTFSLSLIIYFRNQLRSRYRMIADAVFLIPIIALL